MPSHNHQIRRPVRSFVIRGGRLTPGQRRAFKRYWPVYGVETEDQPLDFFTLFGNRNPVWLEIGFGNGESLVQMAALYPERNYLGIEVHPPGVGHCLLKAAEADIDNLRLVNQDAMQVLRDHIPAASLVGLQLFFPDPWHKKRHHKRRIVQPDFLALAARSLQPGGIFHAATDWQDYAEHILGLLREHPAFENLSADGTYIPRPQDRPLTKFEQRGQRLGHGVWDLQFRRVSLD